MLSWQPVLRFDPIVYNGRAGRSIVWIGASHLYGHLGSWIGCGRAYPKSQNGSDIAPDNLRWLFVDKSPDFLKAQCDYPDLCSRTFAPWVRADCLSYRDKALCAVSQSIANQTFDPLCVPKGTGAFSQRKIHH